MSQNNNNISVSHKPAFNVLDYIRNMFQIDRFRSIFASFKEIILPRSLLTVKFIFVPYRTFCASSICNRRPVIKSTRVAQGRASSAEYFLLILTRRRKSKYFRIIHNPDAFGTGIMEVRGIKGFRRGSVEILILPPFLNPLSSEKSHKNARKWFRAPGTAAITPEYPIVPMSLLDSKYHKIRIQTIPVSFFFFFIVVSFFRCFTPWKIAQQEWSLIQ